MGHRFSISRQVFPASLPAHPGRNDVPPGRPLARLPRQGANRLPIPRNIALEGSRLSRNLYHGPF